MFEGTAGSLLPPILAITLAIATRKVYWALGAGVLSGACLLKAGLFSGLLYSLQLVVDTLSQPSNAMIVVFIFVIGSLISSMESAGGIKGFVSWLESSGLIRSKRSVRVLVWLMGVCFFMESNMTILVNGILARPLFDKWKISREKLAYLIDSTSGPICLMIPFNAWGAYVIGILRTGGEQGAVTLLLWSIPYNFYSMFALLLALVVALFEFDIGPMRKAEERTKGGQLLWEGAVLMAEESLFCPAQGPPRSSKWLIIAPVLTVILAMPVSLYLTGRWALGADDTNVILEVMKHGKGSASVLCSVLAGLAVLWGLQARLEKDKGFAATLRELVGFAVRGARGMLPLATIVLLALMLGRVAELLGTGAFVANLATANMSAATFLPVTFILAALVSFSTGTSWGTFAIMIPVVMPAAAAFGVAKAPFLAAALAGGMFGDHASPISNTTIIASMAALTDHADHVRTQLPYALLAGAGAVAAYVLVGVFWL